MSNLSAAAFYQQYYSQPQYNISASGAPHPATTTFAASASSSAHNPVPSNAYEYDVGILAQQSVYVPGAVDKRSASAGKVSKGGKRVTVLRKGAGKVWEDPTLLDWNPSWFRLFVGDLSNDVSDEMLASAFRGYPSFQKARVVRDRLSQKAKFGFVALSDPEDFLKAWKEMDGKYVGNRPIKLKKADTHVNPVEIGKRKAKQLEQEKKRRHKPY